MKRLLITLVALLTLSGIAQATEMCIGYCNNTVSNSGTQGFSSSESDVWVSGAIYVPKSTLCNFAGNNLERVRAGLAARLQIDSLRVWVRTDLEGENIADATITTGIKKGWNDIALNTPVEITTEIEGLYIGYSFHQKGSTFGLSVLPTPCENALFVNLDGNWADRSSEGMLSIEGVVVGDNLPQYNLALEGLRVQKYFSLNMDELTVTATVRNLAAETITSFDAVCYINDYDEPCIAHITTPIAYREVKEITFALHPTMVTSAKDGLSTITVTLDNLAEGTDLDMSDNTMSTDFYIIETGYQRNVLIEEFTTELCGYCPGAANTLHQILSKPEYSNVCLIEHHSGYYTDFLTTSFDTSYEWFYNAGSATYAPAVMFDRYTFGNENTPVNGVGSQASVQSYIDARNADLAVVNLDLSAHFTDEGNVAVVVNGVRANSDVNPERITVFLIEDNIAARSQSGASGSFIHHNVGRKVNSTWGVPVVWEGNKFKYEYTFTGLSSYVADNLGVIAFVSDYNSNNPNACSIYNTSMLYAADFSTAEVVVGDVDGNGIVEIDDMNIILNIMLQKDDRSNWPNADVNGDDVVNIDDMNKVINILLKIE